MGHGPISQEVLLAKTETTYNTDPTPTVGTNAILIRRVDARLDRLRMIDRGAVRASLGTLQQIYAGALRAISFEAEVKGSGAAGTVPELDPLLKACGMGATIVASTSVTYAPASTSISSCTLWWYESVGGANVLHKMTGCRGTCALTFKAGDIVVARFDMVGKPTTVTDVSTPSPTYSSVVPIGIRNLSTTLNAVANLVIQNFSLSLNNSIDVPDSVIDTNGFGNIVITKRDVQLMLQKHAEPVATIDSFAHLTAGTAIAFASGTLGSTAGNRLALNCGQMHVRDIAPGEDANMRVRTLTCGAHETSTADTEFTLVFT